MLPFEEKMLKTRAMLLKRKMTCNSVTYGSKQTHSKFLNTKKLQNIINSEEKPREEINLKVEFVGSFQLRDLRRLISDLLK